jgi:hypothetical protein
MLPKIGGIKSMLNMELMGIYSLQFLLAHTNISYPLVVPPVLRSIFIEKVYLYC